MKKILTLVLFIVTTNMAFAEDANEVQTTPSYSYVGLSLGIIHFDNDYIKGNMGISTIYASAEVGDNIHVGGSYSAKATEITAYDGLDYDYEEKDWSIGGGFHAALNPSNTFHVNAIYTTWSADIDGHSIDIDDDNAITIATGVRNNSLGNLELNSNISTVLYDGTSTVSLSAGLVYSFSSGIGITLDAGVNEDNDTHLLAGLRYTY